MPSKGERWLGEGAVGVAGVAFGLPAVALLGFSALGVDYFLNRNK